MNLQRLELGLGYAAIAGFLLGITTQQILLGLFVLLQLGLHLRHPRQLGQLFAPHHRSAWFFWIVTWLCGFWAARQLPCPDAKPIHWAFIAVWCVGPSLFQRFNWVHLHRTLLCVSVPALLYSIYWLLRPDEIAWAFKVGFEVYPRAAGLVGNPITFGEGMVVLTGWNVARLTHGKPSKRERAWIYAHIGLTALLLVASRIRSALLGLVVLAVLCALITPRLRKLAMRFAAAIVLTFVLVCFLFGFNSASIRERLDLVTANAPLLQAHWLVGIGPNKFNKEVTGLGVLPAHPHNTLLGITTEFGLIGLSAYLLFMGHLALRTRQVLRRYRDPDDPRHWVAYALLFGFTSFHLFGLFDYNFADTELLILHGLSWGLLGHLATQPTT